MQGHGEKARFGLGTRSRNKVWARTFTLWQRQDRAGGVGLVGLVIAAGVRLQDVFPCMVPGPRMIPLGLTGQREEAWLWVGSFEDSSWAPG